MRDVLTTVGEVVGFGVVAFGISLVSVPAALIFAGAALIFICWSIDRGVRR